MAELTYDSLDPGDELTGASLTTRFASITTVINDLDPLTFSPGALNEAHIPSLVQAKATVSRLGTVQYDNNSTGSRHYPQTLDGTDTSGVFDVINIGGNLEVDLGVLQIPGGTVGGVFATVDITMVRLEVKSGGGYTSPQTHSPLMWVAFRLEHSVNGSSWTTIPKTQRVVHDGFPIIYDVDLSGEGTGNLMKSTSSLEQNSRIGIATLITAADAPSGLRYVRAVVSVKDSANPATARVTLGDSHLTAISLRSSLG